MQHRLVVVTVRRHGFREAHIKVGAAAGQLRIPGRFNLAGRKPSRLLVDQRKVCVEVADDDLPEQIIDHDAHLRSPAGAHHDQPAQLHL
ncbi:MAG: hypothetical protein AB7L17_18415 [Ilumatobacteraceae bacterium]